MKTGNLAIITGLLAATFTGCAPSSRQGEFTPEWVQFKFTKAQEHSVAGYGIGPRPRAACSYLQGALATMVGGNMTFEEAGISEKKFQMVKELNGCKFNP